MTDSAENQVPVSALEDLIAKWERRASAEDALDHYEQLIECRNELETVIKESQ